MHGQAARPGLGGNGVVDGAGDGQRPGRLVAPERRPATLAGAVLVARHVRAKDWEAGHHRKSYPTPRKDELMRRPPLFPEYPGIQLTEADVMAPENFAKTLREIAREKYEHQMSTGESTP